MLEHVNSLPAPSYRSPASSSPTQNTGNSPVPIYCSPCGADRGGGFAPDFGVFLCQDRLFSKKHVEDTLSHELIHEWDHRRFKVDWGDLKMVACSEVRLSIGFFKSGIAADIFKWKRSELHHFLGTVDGVAK